MKLTGLGRASKRPVLNADINRLSADSASYAIWSIAEYESLSHLEEPNDVEFNVCLAHQRAPRWICIWSNYIFGACQ
ncbi:hypothetical protein ACHAW6_010146 [Cyclotella cf. meneghiniana]